MPICFELEFNVHVRSVVLDDNAAAWISKCEVGHCQALMANRSFILGAHLFALALSTTHSCAVGSDGHVPEARKAAYEE